MSGGSPASSATGQPEPVKGSLPALPGAAPRRPGATAVAEFRNCDITQGRVCGVTTPLYQLKAEFFKTLGHPARIRVLELLSEREHAVGEMLPEVGIEAANLSQHLAVLRRAGLVATRKEGSSVHYSLTSPDVAELLRVARQILTGVLAGQAQLLEGLRAG